MIRCSLVIVPVDFLAFPEISREMEGRRGREESRESELRTTESIFLRVLNSFAHLRSRAALRLQTYRGGDRPARV
jgi:hypothetical protein